MKAISEETAQRRRKIIRLSYHDLLNAVLGIRVIAGIVKAPTLDLPKGTKVAQLWYEPQANTFCAMLVNPEWDVVPNGVDGELLTVTYQELPVANAELDGASDKLQQLTDANARLAQDLANVGTNRDYCYGIINDIARALGMTGKDHYAPDAILRKVKEVMEKKEAS